MINFLTSPIMAHPQALVVDGVPIDITVPTDVGQSLDPRTSSLEHVFATNLPWQCLKLSGKCPLHVPSGPLPIFPPARPPPCSLWSTTRIPSFSLLVPHRGILPQSLEISEFTTVQNVLFLDLPVEALEVREEIPPLPSLLTLFTKKTNIPRSGLKRWICLVFSERGATV